MGRWLATVAVAGVLALAGCGEDTGDDDVAGNEPQGTTLAGTYVVTKITDGGQPHDLVPRSQVRLTFEDGTLGLQAGCNSMSGDYEVAGDRLTVGPIGGTEMGCEPPLMAQDTWLAGLFAAPVTVGTDPLTLTAGNVVLTLADRETVSPDRPLVGTTWQLDGLVTGDAVSSVPNGVEATLTISEDGSAVFGTGCNGAGATVEVGEGTIAWSDVVTEDKACPGPASEVEQLVLAVLDGATTYTIEERSLTITNGDRGLNYRAP
jgi:heat shock protein HslJ